MSFHPFLFSLTSLLLVSSTYAQEGVYTVWSSVLFLRAGDRTPLVLGPLETALTSLGAQQLYSAGQFFRNRYITDSAANQTAIAPLNGLNVYTQDDLQTYVLALDQQYVTASAQAFMQGFYPPHNLSTVTGNGLDMSNVLANGTYVQYPLGGMSIPHVHTAGDGDPNFIYVGGDLECPSLNTWVEESADASAYVNTMASTELIYESMSPLLSDVLLANETNYNNAWAIYDYLSYLYTHNETASKFINNTALLNTAENITYFEAIRWLADQQQYNFLGNLTAKDPDGQHPEKASTGSMSTIAGATLAGKVLEQIALAMEYSDKYYKLNVLVGDFDPMLSFFALTALPKINSNFYGIPEYGSALVFEVFSWVMDNDTTMPSQDDLWVRFSFRNGTDGTDAEDVPGGLISYSLFEMDPSESDIPLTEFVTLMQGISVSNTGDWCYQCGAYNIFCAAWNSSDDAYSSPSANHRYESSVSAPVAGVIGAILGLLLAGLAVAASMIFGGFRVRRDESKTKASFGHTSFLGHRRRQSSLGGFKGSQKLASDKDLTVVSTVAEDSTAPATTKGGSVVVGASVDKRDSDTLPRTFIPDRFSGSTVASSSHSPPTSPVAVAGHERAGSWELKETGPQQQQQQHRPLSEAGSVGFAPLDLDFERRRQEEEDEEERRVSPFADPVKPDEHV